MLSLGRGPRVFVGVEPVDMRGSFDSLAGVVRRLGLEPTDGQVYLFFNRRRRLCKPIWFDGSGWCLFSKRLSRGTFEVPAVEAGHSSHRWSGWRTCWLPSTGSTGSKLLAGSWMATDATGIKVLIPGLPGCHNGHMECYRRDDLVVFQYEADKGSEALVNKLAPFAGVLLADAEHRHNPVFADGRIREAGCNAHGRRKWRDAEPVQPVLAKEGGAFISAIYVDEAKAQAQGLRGDALREWRRAKVTPIRASLLKWMDAVEPTLTPDDPVAQTIRYYRNHWEALFRFVDHPEIPIDNSATEREFQNFAKLRLNSLFAGSSEGAHRMAILFGIATTCRALNVDTQAYLSWVLTRVGTHRDLYGLSAAELTPAAYARARDG